MMRRPVALLCLLVAGLSACAPEGLRFAIDGAVVRNPATALAAADELFEQWLADVPHDRADGARCYLPATASSGRAGDYHAELEAWCGPILTLEHERDHPWSIISLSREVDAGGRVTITLNGDPEPAQTNPSHLLRANGDAAPTEIGALEYPEPPPLPTDHVGELVAPVATDLVSPTAIEIFAFHSAGAKTARLAIEARFAETLGADRDRLVAPNGHELLLLNFDQHRNFRPGAVEVSLDVDGHQRPFTSAALTTAQHVLVVPEGAPVVMRTREDDVEQSLDIRSGEMIRDPRTTIALEGGAEKLRLSLDLYASWTARYAFNDPYLGDYSYDGTTYQLNASCDGGRSSVFDGRGWAPAGVQVVTIECGYIGVDYDAELRTDALAASARLRAGGVDLEPVDVQTRAGSGGYGWGEDLSATFIFHAPLEAQSATFVFQGHAYVPADSGIEGGVRAFAPTASADIQLR